MRKQLFILMWLCSLTAHAQVEVARLQSASSPFRQTRTSVMLKQPEVKHGTFQYTAPDQIVWTYDGQEDRPLPEQMLAFIRQAVSGDMTKDNPSFDIRWSGTTATLTPKKKQISRLFTKIEIRFTSKGVASRVVLYEPGGNTTEIEFTKMTYKTL